MDEHGIAWMISGGIRSESPEDRRMRHHRIDLSESRAPRGDRWLAIRERIAAVLPARSAVAAPGGVTMGVECCA